MIEGLKPYAEYKESGLPWLGRCPKNWSVRRAKILFLERVQKGFPNEPLLAATQTKGVVKKEDYGTRTVTAQKDLHLLKLVEVGDYVISLRSFQGGIEVAHCRGIISPAYTVLKPRITASSGYYSHFFKAKPFIESLSLFVTGIREGQNIDYERLSRAELPMPSEAEQAAIVRFLDYANRKIDGFIRAKRKLIGLLNEQKQAIIHRAVTRGLNPDVPMKPSGIPWLGEIPGHWEVMRLGRIAQVFNGTTPSRNKPSYWVDGIIPWLPSGKVNNQIVTSASEFVTVQALRECSISLVPKGSVIIGLVGQGKTRGMSALLGIDACINQNLAAIIPKRCLDSHYLIAFLTAFYQEVREFGRGGNQEALNCGIVKNLRLSMPPLNEQLQLVSLISIETMGIDTAISRTEREIALMQEYRTRLTADLVTGKLDVREAAAKLPDPPAEAVAEPLTDDSLEESESEDADT
jgi:type I restriction enzyme S subunit